MYFEPLLLSSLRKTINSFKLDFRRFEFHLQVSIGQLSRAFRSSNPRDRQVRSKRAILFSKPFRCTFIFQFVAAELDKLA